MKFRLFILLFFFISITAVYTQTGFSKTAVKFESHEFKFFPFIKGAFEKSINGVFDTDNLGYDKKQESRLRINLQKIISIFDNYAPLNPPQGLNAKLQSYTEVRKFFPSDKPRLTGMIDLYLFAYHEDENGQPATLGETANYVTIYFNNPALLVGVSVLDNIFLQPAKCGDFYSYPINETGHGEVTVLTNIKRPLFLPVSQEEFLNKTVEYYKKKITESIDELKEKDSNLSPRQVFERDKAQRKKDFEAAYAQILKVDKAAASEYKKTFEQTEKELALEMNSNADLSISKTEITGQGNAIIEQTINKLKAELNSLSSKERKQPAYYSQAGLEAGASGLVPSGSPEAEALIKINPGLLDSKLPQSDVQLVIIKWHGLKPREYNGNKDAFNIESWFLAQLSTASDFWKPIIGMLTK